MRCVTAFRLAVLGLALAIPAATWAGPPEQVCQECQTKQKHKKLSHTHSARGPRLCANCLEAQRQANGGVLVPPQFMVPGTPGCAVCEAKAASASSMAPVVMYAGSPQPPGYAVAGEPVPVGVVQASYRPSGPATASSAPGHAVVGPAVPADPSAWSSANSTTLSRAHHDRPRVLMHLFGLRELDPPFEGRKEKARERHAAIAYGSNSSSVSELPASMVYGNGGR